MPRTNFGMTTDNCPLYAIKSGKLATIGTTSLYLHLSSTTSSTKPRSTTMQIANKPALYSIRRSDVKLKVTYWTIEQHKKIILVTIPKDSGTGGLSF